MHSIIGTWKMSYAGVAEAYEMLAQGCCAGDAVQHAIMRVEDEPSYSSVGYGGLPDRSGHVMLDAAYMDGNSLRFGAIMSAENIRNPICTARMLCGRETNCVLAGRGAEQFAIENGLAMRNMRTEASMQQWREALLQEDRKMDAYREHDTVCVIARDESGAMVVGTSTSGLFMKEAGRVGDSPIVGSGFYCDARYGAAAATGLGEDIMRGCLSYEIVSLMRYGCTAQQACERALKGLADRKIQLGEDAGSISVIAMAPDGTYGSATTLPLFPFAAGKEKAVSVYSARPAENGEMCVASTTIEAIQNEP